MFLLVLVPFVSLYRMLGWFVLKWIAVYQRARMFRFSLSQEQIHLFWKWFTPHWIYRGGEGLPLFFPSRIDYA